MSDHYDSDQLAAIEARFNAVIRAGAGAGKTSVLVGRYIRLVAVDRIPVDEILTLTFTRKAAAEMHERIYAALARRASSGPSDGDPAGDEEFVRKQLERFDSAVISTLDSFCGSVARSGCTAFGVAPTFTVDEARLDEFCDDLALRFLTSRASPDESGSGRVGARAKRAARSVASLVRLNQFGPLWHNGFALLAKNHFLVSRELDLAGMVVSQREYLLAELVRNTEALEESLAKIALLNGDGTKCIANAQRIAGGVEPRSLFGASFVPKLRECLQRLEDSHDQLSEEIDRQVGGLLSNLDTLSTIRKRCGSSRKPEVVEFKSHVDDLHISIARLHELLLTLRSWHETAGAIELAGEFQSIVIAEKRRTGILSYQDVTALAISALSSNCQLRRYYKRRFKAIMIDEFQDNNDEQKMLLYLLAERTGHEGRGVPDPTELNPGKLFFVGDEKQSIYGFRGANVSVFKNLAGELGGERSAINLRSNYRSEPGLIRFFNAFFSQVFSNPNPAYEARFVPLRARAPTPELLPSVQLWQLARHDKGTGFMEDGDAEAFHIARYIRKSVDDGSLVVRASDAPASDSPVNHDPTSAVRPVRYGDFAILMRSTGNQIRLERMLRLIGVPYVAQTARSLFLEAPMNDIYNVLQLVLYPQDRVALAAFLRSPLVGMTDDGIVRVLAADGYLRDDVPNLSSLDTKRHELAIARCSELAELADTARLTDLVHRIWYHWGYRYHLLRREEHTVYLEHYDYIYELARQHEDRGLARFLTTVRSNMGRKQRTEELNTVREESDGVQIMTIHKAKGLEFPVVIMADVGNRGRSDTVSAVPFYYSRAHGLAFNVSASRAEAPQYQVANFIYRAERDEAELKEIAELRRLLYVGSTRAKCHLIFSGLPRSKGRSLMALLEPPFAAAAEELRDAPDVSVVIRDLSPLPTSTRFEGQHRSKTRDIAELSRVYSAAAIPRRNFPRRAFTATELNTAFWDINLAPRISDPPADGTPEYLTPVKEDPVPVDRDLDRDEVFGSFVHYCVEQLGTRLADSRTLNNPARLPASIRPSLEGNRLHEFLAEGVALAESFLASDIWKLSEKAASYEFELPFLLHLADQPIGYSAESPRFDVGAENASDNVWVRGKMDLVLDVAGKVLVIDFKTDHEISPEKYVVQMELYRRAACAIYDKSAETLLYHFRTGATLTVDREIDDSVLWRLVSSLRDSDP